MTDYVVRRAAEGDEEQIVRLVSEMFEHDITERYEWLYRDNPHGHAITWFAFLADTPDEPVALTSVFPRKVMVAGKQRVGSIGGDCYVVPKARRKGLATLLHRTCFADMREAGVDFMYGPPLPNNLRALLKAGSKEVGVYRRFTRPLSGDAAGRLLSKGAVSSALGKLAAVPMEIFNRASRADTAGTTLHEVTEFGPEFDDLFARAKLPASICPVRDAAFLQWRYLAPKSRTQVPLAVRRGGQLVGFAAYEAKDEVAIVVDVFTVDSTVLDAAMQLLIDRARAEDRIRLDYYVTPGALRPRQLVRRGFVPREDRVFQVAATDGEPQRAALHAEASWFITEGDQDMPTCFSDEPT